MKCLNKSHVRGLQRISPLLVLTLLSRVPAEDWTEFRGPNGQGISTAQSVPREWGADRNVAWKTEVPGEGWSSPVLAAGRIYLTSAVAPPSAENPDDRQLLVLCFDADSGKQLWSTQVFTQTGTDERTRIHRKNSHASPTPILHGDQLFVHFGTLGTACLSTDGSVIWRNQELVFQPVHGNGGSPVLFEDLLIFSCDGGDQQFVVALDTKSGIVRWKTERPEVPNPKKFSFCTPLIVEIDGKSQLISPAADCVVSYDPRSGEQLWFVRYQGYSVIPRPVFAHGLIFVSTSYDRPQLLAIAPGESGDVTETNIRWSTGQGAPHTASVLVVADELYFVSDNGIAHCVDARTGDVHWKERLGGNYSASPVFADGAVYFQSEQGETHVVHAGREFVELATNTIPERTLASPAIQDGALFIRSAGSLYRIGPPASARQ